MLKSGVLNSYSKILGLIFAVFQLITPTLLFSESLDAATSPTPIQILTWGVMAGAETSESLPAVRLMRHFYCIDTYMASSDTDVVKKGISRTIDELLRFEKSGSKAFFSNDTIWTDVAMAHARLSLFAEKEGDIQMAKSMKRKALEAGAKSENFHVKTWKSLKYFVTAVDKNYKAKAVKGLISIPPECYPGSNTNSTGRQQ